MLYKLLHCRYPFDTKLDYSKFTVQIPSSRRIAEVLDPYRKDSVAVRHLQTNLARVAKYLQFNDVTAPGIDEDAFDLIMEQVGEHFGFVKKSKLI